MPWSYKRLWYLLVDHNLKKTELMRVSGINSNALAHLSKNEPVTMDSLGKICQALHCRLEDIVEYIPEPEEDQDATTNQ